MNRILSLVLLTSFVACSTKKEDKPLALALPTTLEGSIASGFRNPENAKRDMYRHPLETLKFFEVTPEMTVVEIWPSSGWYTEILAPYLGDKGLYIMADTPEDPKGYTLPRQEWLKKHWYVASKTQTTKFLPPTHLEIAPPGTADRVLTFRNVHNWEGDKGKQAAFHSFFKALKPGGILGVVEHRASEKKKLDPNSGYIKESDVIKWAKKAGFKLLAKSEINANPKDTKDYADGVWTLPPRLRLGDKDKAKYLEIGESDRMTLKFIKPKK